MPRLGIYPREPRNKKKASKSSTPSTTFYYTKDIQYLLHEPLLQKFRDHKALSKKIARSLGRGEVSDAVRLEKSGATKISLDHIIKERYPTFVDALRDLDDALSLLFLFASLPSTSTVPPKTIALCQRLCHEFQHYLIISHSLRKSFLSIKGIYYQATIQGQDILWLVPYKFVQRVTGDVDFRIMGTFVEFYTTLLGFVNFRLYTSIGLVYPPKFSVDSDQQGGELSAFTLEGKSIANTETMKSLTINGNDNQAVNGKETENEEIQKRVNEAMISADNEPVDSTTENPEADDNGDAKENAIDTFEATGNDADILAQPQISNSEASQLFSQFTVYLSRETPRQPLEFILIAFGCKRVGWDEVLGDGAYTTNESDATITHQIVDRPPPSDTENSTTRHRYPNRAYVQPQWVWDCINESKLLRPDLYAPGTTLPPHLSPWVRPTRGAYDPTLPLAEQEREGEADEFAEAEAETAAVLSTGVLRPQLNDASMLANDEEDPTSDNGMDVASSDESEESEPEGEFDGFDEDQSGPELSDDNDIVRSAHQAELRAEASGLGFDQRQNSNGENLKGILKTDARKRAEKKRREADDELQRRMGMMSRKKRKLMEKMMYGKRQGEAEAELLRTKRRRLEK